MNKRLARFAGGALPFRRRAFCVGEAGLGSDPACVRASAGVMRSVRPEIPSAPTNVVVRQFKTTLGSFERTAFVVPAGLLRRPAAVARLDRPALIHVAPASNGSAEMAPTGPGGILNASLMNAMEMRGEGWFATPSQMLATKPSGTFRSSATRGRVNATPVAPLSVAVAQGLRSKYLVVFLGDVGPF